MFSGFLVGLAFGFILQRGQFCFVSGFRSLIVQRNLSFLTALFIAISIQSLGLFTLAHFNLITIPQGAMPIIATLLGGFVFGIGMHWGNCCGSGSWFRTGEGAVGSFISLIAFALTMAATQTGILKIFVKNFTEQTSNFTNIQQNLAISPWVLVSLLLLITIALIRFQKQSCISASSSPFSQRIFKQRWSPYITACCLGLLGILAWWLSSLTGRNYGYGIAVPSANVVQYIVLGQHRFLNWGTLFVLAIPLGAFLDAKLSGEFQWKVPEAHTIWQRVIGGILMGIGAALMGGCTVTNALVATAYFSWQGWLATLMIFIGFGFALKFIQPLHKH